MNIEAKKRDVALVVDDSPETLRLLTKIPLRALVRAVAAHARDLAPPGCDLEAAVHVTEDAEGRTPYVGRLLFVHHCTPVPWGSLNLSLISACATEVSLCTHAVRLRRPASTTSLWRDL